MQQRFLGLTRLEGMTMLLTALFIAATLLWFLLGDAALQSSETIVRTSHSLRVSEAREEPEAPGMLEGEVLDLNSASESDLTRLPGIGEKRASDIVSWREEHNGFTDTEELMDINGIGETIYQRLAPYVTVVPGEKGEHHGEDPGS